LIDYTKLLNEYHQNNDILMPVVCMD